MKSSPRTTAALGALLTLCVAAPVASASRPDGAGGPGDHAAPAATEHSHGGTDGGSAPATPAPPATCDYPAPRRVFAPWHDRKSYVLTENGGLEQGDAGWTLADGAAAVEGNEPFLVNDAADHQSLSLPAGSSATSPATCFASQNSAFRLVARTSGDRSSRLRVEVLYTKGNGHHASRVAGRLRGRDEWRPTKRLSLAIGRAKGHGRLTTGTVAFRFTPIGAGDWQIDDLHLDPRARH
jgi:hypothetical protein